MLAPPEKPEWHPFNIEAEQALLGAILLNNDVYGRVSDLLEPHHFYEELHADLFSIFGRLIGDGKLASPVTVKMFISPDVEIGGLSPAQYLARLAAEGTGTIVARDYAQVIRDMADRRLIVDVGNSLIAPNLGRDAPTVAAAGIEALDEVVAQRSNTGTPALSLDQAIVRAVDATAQAYQREGRVSGLAYGLSDLDRMTLGAQRGELVVIAGRPGMGKTAIGLSIARNMVRSGHKGMFNSLEMGDVSLTQRMLADEIYDQQPLSYWKLRSGNFDARDFDLITDAARRLEGLPLRIEQQPAMTLSQIATRARQMKRRGGLDFIVIDHLGLVRPSNRYAGNKANEIGEITSGFKGLAKELDVAAILLCQLNRGVEGREDKRPSMADLRASGDIEQDADTIIMLYRAAYYLARKEPLAGTAEFLVWEGEMEQVHNLLEAIVEKQRNGPVGRVKLFCDIGCNAVRNLGSRPGEAARALRDGEIPLL